MKLIILSALVAAAAAGYLRGGTAVRGPVVGGLRGGLAPAAVGPIGARLSPVAGGSYGYDSSLDYYSTPDYSTAHSVKDAYSGVDIDSQENRLADRTEGSYSTQLPDGRKQVVTYWVDGNSGYNADVQYYGTAQHPQTPIVRGGALASPLGYGAAGVGDDLRAAGVGAGYGVGGVGASYGVGGGGAGYGVGGVVGRGVIGHRY